MRISVPGLGRRLRRARNETKLSQEAVAERVGVSWMTVHRWERSQRAVPEDTLKRLCEVYDKPLRWFLTLEEGDLEQIDQNYREPIPSLGQVAEKPARYGTPGHDTPSEVAGRVYRRIAEAPAEHLPLIERVVNDILESLGPDKH